MPKFSFPYHPVAAALAVAFSAAHPVYADGISGTERDSGLSSQASSPAKLREVSRKPVNPGLANPGQINPANDPVAQVQAALTSATQALSGGAQVAVLPYRASRVYQVDIKPGMFTTFTFPRDEVIRQFAVSNPDAAEIMVNADTNAAMLRLTSTLTMSGTVVTDKRAYYLTISPATGAWHQGVSWSYDDEGVGGHGFGYRAPAGSRPLVDTSVPEPEDALAGHPNFEYHIEGDAAILPATVWDNGRFTWIQFPKTVQSIPAVFYLGPDGPEVVNYVVTSSGRQIKVNRLMDRFMLRLGSQKATVTAR